MAHKKETPRQKMIGMMYLVLTCLLAMNVSKDILKGFVTINESLERTNKNFKDNTAKFLSGMETAIGNGHNEVKPYLLKSHEAIALTSKVDKYIDEIKAKVQAYTEDTPGADTMRLRYILKQDDFDKPTYFLIGDDEHSPKKDVFSACDLRTKLNQLSKELIEMVDRMQTTKGQFIPPADFAAIKSKIKSLRPVDPNEKEDDIQVTWEIQNFNHLPLAAVITNLSKIQSDLHNIESEVISTFASASGKLAIKFDTLMPRVVSESDYVQLGQPYNGEVFLAASSSNFTSENVQMVLGDIDRKSGLPAPGANLLTLINGKGAIQLPSNKVGEQIYKGVIKFKDGSGNYNYFPFEKKYIVAPSSVAVSADKMNVFYTGVANPISVSAAGIAPQNLVVTLKGCSGTINPTGHGKYEVKVNTPGKGYIQVSAKTNNGLKQQGEPVEFRINDLPTPLPKAGNTSGYGTQEISAMDAKLINAIGADLSNFQFKTQFVVKSFTIGVKNNKGYFEFSSQNNQIPAGAKAEILRCSKGSKIFISEITAIGPDNKIRKLSDLILKLK